MIHRNSRWLTAVLAVALVCSVLSLYRLGDVVAQEDEKAKLPFRNPVEQRQQMIQELQEVKALLKEQNLLLQKLVDKK